MALIGRSLVNGDFVGGEGATFRATDPQTNEVLEPDFVRSGEADIDSAMNLAVRAFPAYRQVAQEERAAFLDAIGEKITGLGQTLIDRCMRETALPEGRLTGERTRTVNQLHMFAELIREGSWVDARIDVGDPNRAPAPKPDLRRMLIPIGPVAVFGPSNFPLAFSVAGGDTASALAAGCPVVIKAHPSHPGTSELVATAIRDAASETGMPAGVFALLHDNGTAVGQQLVRHPATRAVGFTGSRRAGRAIMDAAAAREEPIPVFAEMGSINPVFLLPQALAERGAEIAEKLLDSVLLGVGQFCTNPGLVLAIRGPELESFMSELATAVAKRDAGTMLNPAICQAYRAGVEERAGLPRVRHLHVGRTAPSQPDEPNRAAPALFLTDAETYRGTRSLADELFGPSTLLVQADSPDQLEELAAGLEGQLTATLHATEEEIADHRTLIGTLRQRVGRLIVNGFPTGVEVVPAMTHGGPYPAGSFEHFTSVGTAAIRRFSRPVTYQDFPESVLPEELCNANPRGIWRTVDGAMSREAVKLGQDSGR